MSQQEYLNFHIAQGNLQNPEGLLLTEEQIREQLMNRQNLTKDEIWRRLEDKRFN